MKDLLHNIANAIDWVSIRLTGIVIPVFFIPNWLLQTLGAAAVLSSLIYNTIRIIKECWPLLEPMWVKVKLKIKAIKPFTKSSTK